MTNSMWIYSTPEVGDLIEASNPATPLAHVRVEDGQAEQPSQEAEDA
ncbi:hypothetical protein [Actinomadura litoris]|nr:hypothetical protein [Actinomadura litoris]